MGNNLEKLRKNRGWTQDQAAAAFGMSKGGYLKKERSERKLDSEFILRATRVYGVQSSDVFDERQTVPIVGYVGAGSEAHFYAGADAPNEIVTAPPGSNDTTVAVLIRGDSLGDVFEGWVAYYDDVRSPPTPDLLFRLCVVGLEDGRVLIKRLALGTANGFYHLISQAGNVIKDQPVAWAALVKALLPRIL